jgi:hypothetical protein
MTSGRQRIDVPDGVPHHGDLVVSTALALWALNKRPPKIEFGRLNLMDR